jgi:hypothetical protein
MGHDLCPTPLLEEQPLQKIRGTDDLAVAQREA